jgi:hypothetical protein
MVEKVTTAEQMLLDTLAILQRGLPPGDLDDRQVVSELWGIFDNPQSRPLIERARASASDPDRGERH